MTQCCSHQICSSFNHDWQFNPLSFKIGVLGMRGGTCATIASRTKALQWREPRRLKAAQSCSRTSTRLQAVPLRRNLSPNGWPNSQKIQKVSREVPSALDDSLAHPIPEPEQSGGKQVILSATRFAQARMSNSSSLHLQMLRFNLK